MELRNFEAFKEVETFDKAIDGQYNKLLDKMEEGIFPFKSR